MQNSELADRIAALDWSGASLQHLMSAAVTTLRGGSVPDVENPVGELQLLLADLVNNR